MGVYNCCGGRPECQPELFLECTEDESYINISIENAVSASYTLNNQTTIIELDENGNATLTFTKSELFTEAIGGPYTYYSLEVNASNDCGSKSCVFGCGFSPVYSSIWILEDIAPQGWCGNVACETQAQYDAFCNDNYVEVFWEVRGSLADLEALNSIHLNGALISGPIECWDANCATRIYAIRGSFIVARCAMPNSYSITFNGYTCSQSLYGGTTWVVPCTTKKNVWRLEIGGFPDIIEITGRARVFSKTDNSMYKRPVPCWISENYTRLVRYTGLSNVNGTFFFTRCSDTPKHVGSGTITVITMGNRYTHPTITPQTNTSFNITITNTVDYYVYADGNIFVQFSPCATVDTVRTLNGAVTENSSRVELCYNEPPYFWNDCSTNPPWNAPDRSINPLIYLTCEYRRLGDLTGIGSLGLGVGSAFSGSQVFGIMTPCKLYSNGALFLDPKVTKNNFGPCFYLTADYSGILRPYSRTTNIVGNSWAAANWVLCNTISTIFHSPSPMYYSTPPFAVNVPANEPVCCLPFCVDQNTQGEIPTLEYFLHSDHGTRSAINPYESNISLTGCDIGDYCSTEGFGNNPPGPRAVYTQGTTNFFGTIRRYYDCV